ncbi:MAG: stage V sporulation protein S [Anaerolineae bacterium]|jgi:stage V sporulation protein S|nr:stage V sporulation protein S [Anaerolineae bacterium]MBT7188985.1 stage V sporulation protein S [Anaerolineae bacterium]MBT7990205.1 stage V sporulation protein S [Anaerolineae bacterium]
MDIIKVSARSRTSAVAGAIAGVFREHGRAEVQAIGAGAVNQSVKALVLAISYLKERDGIDVACVPEFVDVEIEDKVRTAIKLVVEDRRSFPSDELSELDSLDEVEEEESPIELSPESDLLDPSTFVE